MRVYRLFWLQLYFFVMLVFKGKVEVWNLKRLYTKQRSVKEESKESVLTRIALRKGNHELVTWKISNLVVLRFQNIEKVSGICYRHKKMETASTKYGDETFRLCSFSLILNQPMSLLFRARRILSVTDESEIEEPYMRCVIKQEG